MVVQIPLNSKPTTRNSFYLPATPLPPERGHAARRTNKELAAQNSKPATQNPELKFQVTPVVTIPGLPRPISNSMLK